VLYLDLFFEPLPPHANRISDCLQKLDHLAFAVLPNQHYISALQLRAITFFHLRRMNFWNCLISMGKNPFYFIEYHPGQR